MALLVSIDTGSQWTPTLVHRDKWEEAFLAFLGSKTEHTRRGRGKGGKSGRRELPPPAARALRAYLDRDGR